MSPSDDTSLYEARVQAKNLTHLGLISLNTGNYQRSKMEFGCVLSMHVNEFRTRFDVMAYLGDMYCELRKPEEALSLLERVIKSTNANSHLEDMHPI